ncbi:MAG: zf-HC2 domain-containing protein [Candidatus Eremiobacteraeota bacterium]|nr:zf-HC2 domain-containing protein [Candidatus Eremiobacteraeota bacterium]
MECKEVREKLGELLSGDAPPGQREALERHLAACDACRREKEAHEKSWDLLGAYGDIEPHPSYRARFWEQARRKRGFFERVFAPAWRPAVALALLAVLVLFWSLTMAPRQSGDDLFSGTYMAWRGGPLEGAHHYVASLEERQLLALAPSKGAFRLPDYLEEEPAPCEELPELFTGHERRDVLEGAHEVISEIERGW